MAVVVIPSAQFGTVTLDEIDLDCLCEWTGQDRAAVVKRLEQATVADMAAAWRDSSPSSDDDILSFYGQTDLYVWELMAWNSSPQYDRYRERLTALNQRFPSSSHPKALDYGSGVGTAALWLAQHGYDVTIADVPGPTLDFARMRLARHGVGFHTLQIDDAIPEIASESFDVVVSFDVLEHLTHPVEVSRLLARAVRRGGGAALVAAFGHDEGDHPHHLSERASTLIGHRFDLWLEAWGLRAYGDALYRRMTPAQAALRRVNHLLWRSTGFQLRRIPR